MAIITRPMKGEAIPPEQYHLIRFPKIATPKFDGHRCEKVDGVALSCKFLPIANDHTRQQIQKHCPNGVDGELLVSGDFNATQRAINTKEGKPNFEFHLFDWIFRGHTQEMAIDRLLRLEQEFADMQAVAPFLRFVPYTMLYCLEDLVAYEKWCVEQGYEGCMLRDPFSPYKNGRATLKQQWLLKVKRFEDAEGVIVDFVQSEHNTNKAEKNELGLTKRSKKKSGIVLLDTLGGFIVRTKKWGDIEVGNGKGLTKKLKKYVWTHKSEYLGKTLSFRFFPHGMREGDKPRSAQYKGIRYDA